MLRQYELVDLVKSYDPEADEDALNRAYVFAMKKHGGQLRTSGDPYYSHPIEVAGILTKFKLDSASIIAGLLHDTVEDTDTTVEEVRELFGDQVASLVDGLTKLAMIEQKSGSSKQAENFRKLLLAMSDDIRVSTDFDIDCKWGQLNRKSVSRKSTRIYNPPRRLFWNSMCIIRV